jgi:nucleoside-diphosphate-sugar epimerase
MKVLVIGGNRFLGIELVARLLAHGDQVTLLNRGTLSDPFGDRVRRLTADRGEEAFDRTIARAETTWDAVVDFALFTGPEAERSARVLRDRVGHYVMISTGQVYLVRDVVPSPARESDYHGPLMAEPTQPADRDQFRYGFDKREAEEVIAKGFHATRLRLPMVHGGRDHYRRIDGVIGRLLDGGPIVLTRPDAPCQHVFSAAVVRAIDLVLRRGPQDDVFNLAQAEVVPVRELVTRLGATLGVTPRIEVVEPAALAAKGLDAVKACPFNARWMSALDASHAQRTLGFVHEPLDVYLAACVHASLSRWSDPPSLSQREAELEFVRRRS